MNNHLDRSAIVVLMVPVVVCIVALCAPEARTDEEESTTAELPTQVYRYHGEVKEVYDGDTMTVVLDLGFNVMYEARIRLEGVDTPELRGDEREEGLEVRDHVRDLVLGKQVVVTSKEKGKYGRWIGSVLFMKDGQVKDLGSYLVRNNMAGLYEG